MRAEQPPGGEEHAAAEPPAGLRSAAGPGGHAHCWPWDRLGESRPDWEWGDVKRSQKHFSNHLLVPERCSSVCPHRAEDAPPPDTRPASDFQRAGRRSAAAQRAFHPAQRAAAAARGECRGPSTVMIYSVSDFRRHLTFISVKNGTQDEVSLNWCVFCVFYLFYDQPGMHVNGAPQMMQPPNMGVVPGPMPVPGPGQGPVPGPVGPPGNSHH